MNGIGWIGVLMIVWTLISCGSTNTKEKINDKPHTMELTITDIRYEKDGQTLFLSDEKGGKYTTVISIPNGNYVEVKKGDRISLVAKEILEMHPALIISENIVVLGESQINYEKEEEATFWVHARSTMANGMWGQPVECLKIQKSQELDITGKWDLLCDEIEHFTNREGTYYRVKVLKKWLKNHENLMDRAPYDLELITVMAREIDPTYVHPVRASLTTDKSTYNIGAPIHLTMTMTNTGDKAFTFLPWSTPMENSFTGDCLHVLDSAGNPVNYSGIMVKRMPPTDKDYVTLEKGESATGKVNILDGYKLDKQGTYTITFKEDRGGLPGSNTITLTIK